MINSWFETIEVLIALQLQAVWRMAYCSSCLDLI